MAVSTVVNAAYDTSGNGGRKLVKLSNGWFVAAVVDTTNKVIYFEVSKDNGQTWSQLCFSDSADGLSMVSIQSNGTRVFAFCGNATAAQVRLINFDAVTVTNVKQAAIFIETQSAVNNVSLAINSTGTELHAAWSSKNSTYPNSFNIRYAKGTIDGSGNVTWGSVEQVTKINDTTRAVTNPSIVVKSDGTPLVIADAKISGSSSTYIVALYKGGSSWVNTSPDRSATVYDGGAYAQSNPCAVVDGNGVIHVVWHGSDATDSAVANIRYSKSTDGGATWSAPTKLTTGNTRYQQEATISVDLQNKLYVHWVGRDDVSAVYYQLKRRIYDGAAWGTIATLTNNSSANNRYPNAMEKASGGLLGLIWKDEQASAVKFDSIIFNQSPTITLTSPSDNQTLVEGNAYEISGSASESDVGNVVTVKYKIDDGQTYNISAGVSDGTTPINFNKTLTYLNNRLYDGQTAVTPILDDQVTHTLTVWAEDDQGGKSTEVTRNFTVLYNQPPQISGSDQDLGSISAPPSINYTVTDIEHYSFTITEKVGDTIIRSFAGTDGKQETLTIPDDIWITLQPDVTHNLTITATDQYGASSTRTYTFKRIVDGIELETRTPLPADAQPHRMVLTLNAQYPTNAVVNVQVCNNGYDDTPTWEDATSAVLNKRPYVFTNVSKTAENWGIKVKISILPGA